jgi:hypothetical protein
VRERVRHHRIALADQRRDHAEIRRIAAVERERGLGLEELRELLSSASCTPSCR